MNRWIFLPLIWGFSIQVFFAQNPPYRFQVFQINDGLCHNRLTDLYQDETGFLWIATENGLSRFDGQHFKNFYPNPQDASTLSSEVIFKILPDDEGSFWLQTTNGLLFHENQKGRFQQFLTYPHDMPTQQAARFSGMTTLNNQIYFLKDGRDWMVFDRKKQSLRPMPMPETLEKDEPVLSVFKFSPAKNSDSAALTLATRRGFYLFRSDDETWSHFPFDLTLDGGHFFYNIGTKVYGAKWENGFFIFDWNTLSIQNLKLANGQKLPNIIHSFLPLQPDQWWLGTEGGLYSLNPQTGENHRIILPNETDAPLVVHDVLQDQTDNVWLATENGLLLFDPRLQGFQYQNLTNAPRPVYENQIYDVEVVPDLGKVFVTSRGGQIYVLDDSYKPSQPPIPIFENTNAEPTALFQDSRKQFWLSTRHEVYHFDPTTFKTSPLPAPPRREGRLGLIWAIAEDDHGRLWFGLSRDGVFIFDPKNSLTQYLTCAENQFCALQVLDMKMDQENGKIWVATDGEGLWEGDLETLQFRVFNQKNCPALPSDQIMYLELDQSGALWLSTPVGLCRFDTKKLPTETLQCFTVADGLPVNFLEGLTIDVEGNLWGGSTGKLIRLHPENLKTEVFDHRFGVDFTPYPISSIVASPTGEMFAGGKWRILRWHPQRLKSDTLFPKIVLTGLKVLGQSFQTETAPEYLYDLTLRHDQNALTFEFSALDFTLPDFNNFEWRLEGYEEHWSSGKVGQNAVYTQIPPGKYVFKVRNIGEVSGSENELKMHLFIRPAFWQTWWFQLLCIITFFAIIIGIYRERIRQIQEKEALKTAFQKGLAEIEMTALRAQMNPHFVFNCLNSINRFIQMSDPDTASDYLTKFARLIRLVLDNSREEAVTLENEIQALRLYVELEALRYAGRFEYDFVVDETLDTWGIDIPPLVIQPFIENAIWHGLMHKTDDNGRLKISFLTENQFLNICIEDNGVGRAAAAELKSKSAVRQKSHGMALTAERLAAIQELYGRSVNIAIQDLVNPDGSSAGTKVVLRIEI